jgi:hypothetical protein
VFLTVNGRLYLRDPKNVLTRSTPTRFDADAKLPTSATDTGYRSAAGALWLDPEGDAYLVKPGKTERWPRSTDPQIGCA